MSALHHHRTQFPVGEGFFHWGCVWGHGADEMNLSYVYDCGAQSSYRAELEAQIKEFAATHHWRGDSPELDLLFLSHAHVDHVSGVSRLMEYVSVGTVVMPLIEPGQRLMAFAHAALNGEIDSDVQVFYEEFTANPVGAVLARGAQRVIEVAPNGPGEREGAGTPSGPTPEPDSDDLPQDVQADGVEVVEVPLAGGDTAPQSWRLVGTGQVQSVIQDGVTVLRIPDTMHFEATAAAPTFPWVLVPHVDPPVRRRAMEFRAELERQLGITSPALDAWFADPARMRRLVAAHRSELVASYLHASQRKDLNITSLSLYSGPDRSRPRRAAPEHVSAALEWQRGRHHMRSWSIGGDDLCVGWLGTGDAALKQEIRRTPFLARFEPYSNFVHTMTLPHHGSSHSYHPELVHKLAPQICVAPAAPYSTWQHPGPSVVASASQHALVLPVSHIPDSRLSEYVYIDVR